jgi:hypothetical protein
MEVKRRRAVLLMKDGTFERVRIPKGQSPAVGEEFSGFTRIEKRRAQSNLIPSLSFATAVLILFVLIAGVVPLGEENRASAAAYVSFDINPSLEVGVDSDLDVIKLRTLNDDAEELLPELDSYVDMPLSKFTQSLMEQFAANGYFDSNKELLVVTSIVEKYLSSDLQAVLDETVNNIVSESTLEDSEVALTVINTDEQRHGEAIANGLSMGKYLAFLDAVKDGHEISVDDAKNLSYMNLKELMEQSQDKLVTEDEDSAEEDDQTTKDDESAKDQEEPSRDQPPSQASQPVNEEQSSPQDEQGSNPEEQQEPSDHSSNKVSPPVAAKEEEKKLKQEQKKDNEKHKDQEKRDSHPKKNKDDESGREHEDDDEDDDNDNDNDEREDDDNDDKESVGAVIKQNGDRIEIELNLDLFKRNND